MSTFQYSSQPIDLHFRPMRDLRISLTDFCNFRCSYCMPADREYRFLKADERLSFDEIMTLSSIFASLGVRKIRITGGEPLFRKDIGALIRRFKTIPEIEDISLTTNGYLLAQFAQELKDAGLNRLTVSVDTLDPRQFQKITNMPDGLERLLAGIQAAESVGFEKIKINAVIRKGLNENAIIPLVNEFLPRGHIVRFIEFMDVGNSNRWDLSEVITSRHMVNTLSELGPLVPVRKNYFGEVASRYEFLDGRGEVGFISSVSQPFCGTCTRTRLSADGKFFTCLFAERGFDLRTPLRSDKSLQVLREKIQETWSGRSDRYSEERVGEKSEGRSRQKVEMYHIGG